MEASWGLGHGSRNLGPGRWDIARMEHGVSHPAQSLVDVNCNESVIRTPQELLFSLH